MGVAPSMGFVGNIAETVIVAAPRHHSLLFRSQLSTWLFSIQHQFTSNAPTYRSRPCRTCVSNLLHCGHS